MANATRRKQHPNAPLRHCFLISGFRLPRIHFDTKTAGEIPMPPEMYAAFEEALADGGLVGAAAAIDAGCANFDFPEVETSAEPEPGTPGGLLVMEFSDVVLEYEFEDCSIESMEVGESWHLGNGRQVTTNIDGSEWQISALLNAPEPGGFGFQAIGPPGADYAPYFVASPNVGSTMESIFDGTTAQFMTVFSDNIYQGEPDTAVTITMTCDI